jgi:hypothetical protein
VKEEIYSDGMEVEIEGILCMNKKKQEARGKDIKKNVRNDVGGVKVHVCRLMMEEWLMNHVQEKSFLENRRIQRLVTHVFRWMATLLYGLQLIFMVAGTRWKLENIENDEDQRSWKTRKEDQGRGREKGPI